MANNKSFLPDGLRSLLTDWSRAEKYFVQEAPFTVYEPDETLTDEELEF
jgi:hypothetical protein